MKKTAASTMLAVLAMLTVLSAFTISALTYTGAVSKNVMATNTQRRATELGDGAMDYMFAYWRELMKEQPNTLRPSKDFATIPLPTQSMFPTLTTFTASRQLNPLTGTKYTIANYIVQAVDPQGSLLCAAATASPPSQPALSDITAVLPSTGMSPDQTTSNYLASCDVTLPAFGGRMITVNLRRIFQKQITSPWQYAIFYNDLLEMHPGATQSITGWVHTNGSLYTAHNQLTFLSKVDYGNDWAIDYAPGDLDHQSDTKTQPNYPGNLPPARGQIQLPFGMDPTQIFTNTNGNNSGYHELIEPPASGPDPIANSRYYDQADIHIMIDTNNNITMTDNAGTVLNSNTVASGSTASWTDKQLYRTFSNAITTNESIQDPREAATMRIASLDVSKISSALATGGANTGYLVTPDPNNLSTYPHWSGIVYISDTSGSSTVKRGVRLKNGAKILGPGLTVASGNPVYVQGDYNSGKTSSTNTPANVNNNSTGNNVVSGYTEVPCAVLADAVTILSNAWSDSNNSYGSRNATPTTVNAAIVAGIVPSGTPGASNNANTYSGGAENFPRFLENWGGQTFTYYGSMVELYQSQQGIGFWGNANVYSPPNRNWHFDTLFYTQPPPGTLKIVTYVKSRWYVQ